METSGGFDPQDLAILLGVLWGLYGGGPFDMCLGADSDQLEEAKAAAVRMGWCAEGGQGIELRW